MFYYQDIKKKDKNIRLDFGEVILVFSLPPKYCLKVHSSTASIFLVRIAYTICHELSIT